MDVVTDLNTDLNTETRVQGPSRSALRLKRARQWHLWLGTLFAPSILFFAFSGSLQLFSLHEGRPGGTYQPPAWIEKMASIHKDQVLSKRHGPPPAFAGGENKAPHASQAGGPPRPEGGQEKEAGANVLTYLLKWFFVFAALGLISSTLLGIYMAFKFNRSRAVVWGLLFAGAAIPVALIAMMP